jgi:phenylacetyl-CoA:acceptor oxidoreductase
MCNYLISCGANVEASGGVVGVWRHANARARGMKRVQVEPHLSVTGACSAEWVPIRPKTDVAFLYALLHVLLHEAVRERLDLAFLKQHTSSPYLVGANGFFLRDPVTRRPLLWDLQRGAAVPFDTPGCDPALEGSFACDAVEIGADAEVLASGKLQGEPSFTKLLAHIQPYSPEWAAGICDVPAASMRRIANEFLDHAQVGASIEIDGKTMPYRPVAVSLGKTVNNGWGGYECVWARTLLATLVGGLEVPGGTLGTTVRLNRPADNRWSSVKPGPDGFMDYPMNPTGRDDWISRPAVRSAHRMLVPLVANSAWSQALGPTHLAWMM